MPARKRTDMADLFRTLIIKASDAILARQIAAAFGPGGENMWTTGLSATGADPATYFISTGYIPAEFVSLSPMAVWTQDELGAWNKTEYYPGDAVTVAAYAAAAGLNITQAQVETIFTNSDVSAQEPFSALSRLGLKIIVGAE